MLKKYIYFFLILIFFNSELIAQNWVVRDSILVFPTGFYSWLKKNNGGIDTTAPSNVGHFLNGKIGTNQGIDVFDFNKDGLTDLTIQLFPSNEITREFIKGIFIQNSTGKYVLDTNYVIKGKGDIWYGGYADFNGDGLMDYHYLTHNYHGADSNRIYSPEMVFDDWPDHVFINNGKTFDTLSLDPNNFRIQSTYTADIDNDGADEIIATNKDRYNLETKVWTSSRITIYKYDKSTKKFIEIGNELTKLWNETISPQYSSYPVFSISGINNNKEFYATLLDSANGPNIWDYRKFTLANYNFSSKKITTYSLNRDSIFIPEKFSKAGVDKPEYGGDDYFKFMIHGITYSNIQDLDNDGIKEIVVGGFYQNNHNISKEKYAYGWKVLGLNGKDLTSKYFENDGIDRGVDLISHGLDIDKNAPGIEMIPGAWGLDPKYYINGSPTLGYYYSLSNGKFEKNVIKNLKHETGRKIDSMYLKEMQIVKYPNYKNNINALLLFDFWDLNRIAILYQADCSAATKPIFDKIKYFICGTDSTTVKISNTISSDSLKWYVNNKLVASRVSQFVFKNSDTLYVTKLDSNGCLKTSDTIKILKYSIPSAPAISRDTANNLVANINGITWYKDGSAINDTTQKFKPTTGGSYTAKTTQNGCISALSAAYYYLVTDIITLNADEFIKLAPNPFSNHLNFDFVVKGYQRLNIEVFDISSGTIVATRQNLIAGTQLYLGQLSAGTYLCKVSSNDGKVAYQFKMVKI